MKMSSFKNKIVSSPALPLSNSLSIQISLPKQPASISLSNLTQDLIENTLFKNEREKYFTDVSINKFANDCLKNTTKHQKDKLRQLMEDVLIEQQKGYYDTFDGIKSTCESNKIVDFKDNSTPVQQIYDKQTEICTVKKNSKKIQNDQSENKINSLKDNSKIQILPIESSSSFFENSLPQRLLNTHEDKFDSKLRYSINNQKQLKENTTQEKSDVNGLLNNTQHFLKKSTSKFSNNMQSLFKYYFRKKNVNKSSLKNSLNKKIKENVKLKNEIIDLLENATNSNQIGNNINFIDEKNNLGTEQKKVLIDELNKKENFLSANINRNILALEDFMNLNQNPVNDEIKSTDCNKLLSNLSQKDGNKIKRFNFYNSKNRINNGDLIKPELHKNSSEIMVKSNCVKDLVKVNNYKKLILIEKPSIEPEKYERGKYLCVECGAKKKKLSELKQHLFTHVNLRPFTCYHCDVSFKTKGNLVKHVKTKAHLNHCIKIGMNADDKQVMQITTDNIDRHILNKQILME